MRFGDVRQRAFVVDRAAAVVAHCARVLQYHDALAILAPQYQFGIADLASCGHVAHPSVPFLGIHIEVARNVQLQQFILRA